MSLIGPLYPGSVEAQWMRRNPGETLDSIYNRYNMPQEMRYQGYKNAYKRKWSEWLYDNAPRYGARHNRATRVANTYFKFANKKVWATRRRKPRRQISWRENSRRF